MFYLNKSRLFLCVLLLLHAAFFNLSISGQESIDSGIFNSEVESNDNLLTAFESMFDGYAELRDFTYFQGDSSDDKTSRVETEFMLKYENDIGDIGRFLVSPRLLLDNDNYSSSFIDETEDDDLRRNSFDLEEYYAELNFNFFDIKVGKQIFSWGRADGFNPTDNLNPHEYIDLFADEGRIGVLAANLTFYLKSYTFNIVVVPTYTPTRLPLLNSRHSFVDPEFIPEINHIDYPSNTVSNMQAAIRVSKYVAGWDVALSYYDGFDDLTLPLIGRGFSVTPTFNHIRVIGLDFATTFGRVGFHGEAAQFIYDSGNDEDYFQYVLGFDYTWTNIVKEHDIFLIMEYMGETTTESRQNEKLAFGSGLARVLTNSVLTSLNYKISDILEFETKLIFNLDDHLSYVIKPEISYGITDAVKLSVGMDIIEGVSSTFFGQFDDDDRAFMSLRYSF